MRIRVGTKQNEVSQTRRCVRDASSQHMTHFFFSFKVAHYTNDKSTEKDAVESSSSDL